MTKDNQVKALVAAGLLVQAGAVGLWFTALGWRWPLIAAAVAVALGASLLTRKTWGFAAAAILVAGWHGMSDAPAAAWALRIVFALEALAQLALAIFLMTFRLTRLW